MSDKDVDLINHPPHYIRGGIECIDALEAMVSGWPPETAYRLGNVLKYLWRHRDKEDPLTSLKKAEFYLKREIEKMTPQPTDKPSPYKDMNPLQAQADYRAALRQMLLHDPV